MKYKIGDTVNYFTTNCTYTGKIEKIFGEDYEIDGYILCEDRESSVQEQFYIIEKTSTGIEKESQTSTDSIDKILEERAKTHGDFRVNFRKIAALWTAYLEYSVSPLDVANMMELLKIARIKNGQKYNKDDFDDIIGYAKLAQKLQEDEHV